MVAWQQQMPKVVMPTDLSGQLNGRLNLNLLDSQIPGGGGPAHHLAARAWRAMHAAALADGVELKSTGNYRTFARQQSLFLERYSRTGTFGGCKTCALAGGPEFQGRWCKKGNFATAACPGTSNHGWALAFDVSTASTSRVKAFFRAIKTRLGGLPRWLQWLQDNAARFGFGWELASENWHVRYFPGDTIPAAVLAYEASLNPSPQPPPPPAVVVPPPTVHPPVELDMPVRHPIVQRTGANAVWVTNIVTRRWLPTELAIRQTALELGLISDADWGITDAALRARVVTPVGSLEGYGAVVGPDPGDV